VTPPRLAVTIATSVIALDALTKALAVRLLAGKGIVDAGPVHFELYRNFAAAGNHFQGHTVAVSAFTALAVIVLFVASRRTTTTSIAVGVGLMLGGAAGNLVDRLTRAPGPLRGGVVDWLKPTLNGGSMNLADVAVTTAVLVIVLASLRSRSGEPAVSAAHSRG
jgi:signal peptidase II